jgi:hypothetical protein
MEQNVSYRFEFFSEIVFVSWNDAVKDRLPIVVHELVHCLAEELVAFEEIIKAKNNILWRELDLVARNVDVSVVVFSLKIFTVQFMSRGKLIHGNIRETFSGDGKN